MSGAKITADHPGRQHHSQDDHRDAVHQEMVEVLVRGVAVAADHTENHLKDHLAADPTEVPEMEMEIEHRKDDQGQPLLAARGAQEAVAVAGVEMTPEMPTTC